MMEVSSGYYGGIMQVMREAYEAKEVDAGK